MLFVSDFVFRTTDYKAAKLCNNESFFSPSSSSTGIVVSDTSKLTNVLFHFTSQNPLVKVTGLTYKCMWFSKIKIYM